MRILVGVLVVLLGCESKSDTTAAGESTGAVTSPVSERDQLVAEVQRKVGTDGIATVAIAGDVLTLDARKGSNECRALMDTMERKFRARLRAAKVRAVRCLTTTIDTSRDVAAE
jgi:hypothetical protein